MAEGNSAIWVDGHGDHVHGVEHISHHSGGSDIGGGHGS